MTNLAVVILGLYVAWVVFNFWVFYVDEGKDGPVTNGGMVFVTFMSLLGPLSIGAAFAALAHGHLSKWASRPLHKRNREDD